MLTRIRIGTRLQHRTLFRIRRCDCDDRYGFCDVELSGCVDETMPTLKKRTMGVGPPPDETFSTRAWSNEIL